jgi:glycosyltransferase involved in cell wall biosynthesis
MKLGYFTHTNISQSETFITDLIKVLNQSVDIELTVFSGKKKHSIKGIGCVEIVSTGYAENGYANSFRLYKVGQIIGSKGNQFKNCFQQIKAYKSMASILNDSELPDVAYVEYGTSAVLCYKYFVEKKIPFVVHVHGFDVTSATNDAYYLKELKKAFFYAAAVITPSQHLKRIVIQQGCLANKVKSIYPVTSLDHIKPIDFANRRSMTPTISFLGRLTQKKNPIALIYSFNNVLKKVPNAKLNVFGDGELRGEVEKLIDSFGICKSVRLFGAVDQSVAFKAMENSHIYVQHSVTSLSGDQEGFPVSLAEAAAHSLPLVSTIHSGITENVIDGKTGFLVQEHDFETMAEKIIYLIEHPDVAEEMGKAGRKHIMELCASGKRVRQIKELLFSVYDSKLN